MNINNIKFLNLFLLSMLLGACDSEVLWEDEQYSVYWIDSPNNIELGIKYDDSTFIGRYGALPFCVGSNDKHLVVQQEEGYYYVIKAEDSWKNDIRKGNYGPFSEQEFLNLSKDLYLPKVEKCFE